MADTPQANASTINKRHIAETKKFEAETRALEAEARHADAESALRALEARMAGVDAEESEVQYTYKKNLDHSNRTFSFLGDIDDKETQQLVESINSWARTSDDLIVVRLNSPGGSVTAGLALYDQLRAVDKHKAPVYTVALGVTASMAGIIFQAGRKRIISENATFMVHEVSVHGTQGFTRSELEDMSKSVDKLNLRLYSILAERSTLSVEEINKRAERKDWEIDAEEALKLGLADEVGYI